MVNSFVVVLSSPSGTGKSTVGERLLFELNGSMVRSISMTSRQRRGNEVDGIDYFFTNKKEFMFECDNERMLEYAEVFGNMYGTPSAYVQEKLDIGIDVLCIIDWQGGVNIMNSMRERVVSIFMMPPSLEALESRLRTRAIDSEDVILRRLSEARYEMQQRDKYDYIVINDKIEDTTQKILSIIYNERSRRLNT